MRIAIYGGSFNPPHVGHAMVAGWLHWTDRVDQVWLVPTRSHPFGKPMASFSFRVRLCEALATTVGDWVRVSTIEDELDEPSYTIDTLYELSRRHPEHRFRLVLGSDNLDQLHAWKDWEGIEAAFAPIMVGRQGYPTPEGAVDFPGVSSTQIRRRLRAGEPVEHLVPAPVLALLGDTYRSGPSPTAP
jgi:nicotinate-nucleotide adenylyltransferase